MRVPKIGRALRLNHTRMKGKPPKGKSDKGEGRSGSHSGALRGVQLPDFSHSLPMALLRGREAVMRYFRPSLRKRGLTEQQWRVLRALNHTGAIQVTELARLTFLLAPSLSRILRDLSRRRLIERKPVKGDRRRNVVSITKVGLNLIRAEAPHSETGYAEIARRFGKKRLAALQGMLWKLETELLQGLPPQ
jgi:homoprotocatechuate degradation regulator HpaR